MSLTITALVIGGHSELDESLFGLENQTRPADYVLVGCTSDEEEQIAQKHGFPFVRVQGSFLEKVSSLASAVENADWYWLLFGNSCPDPTALEQMSLTAETSPSASVVGPKLVDWKHPNLFQGFGKTLTPIGESFELVDKEMDQGQHDLLRDVLAIDFAGSLIAHKSLGEIKNIQTPMAATPIVFGMMQWLSGKRVLVEPKAKVRLVSTPEINGDRNIFGSYFAKRFADYHLSLITLPRFLAFITWLLMPITALARALWLIGSREVRFFLPELTAGLGAFISVSVHIRGSSKLRSLGKLSSIGQLRADRSRIKDRARRKFTELPPGQYRPGLLSGPWAWLLPALVLINFQMFPAAEAVVGGNLLPLNANWLEMASNAWRLIDGFPTDPVVFPISILSLASFWAPSVAIGWFMFFAPAMAFAGSWLALSRLSDNRLLISMLSHVYAIGPIYAFSLLEPDVSVAIIFALLGFLIHGLKMIVDSFVSSRAWRWTAWSSLLMAMIASAAPYLLPLLVLFVVVLALFNLKRLAFLGLVPGLSIILLFPYFSSWIQSPLTVFAPLGAEFEYSNNWELDYVLWLPIGVLFLVSLLAFIIRPTGLGALMLLSASASVAAFASVEHIEIIRTPGFSEPTNANGLPFLLFGIFALLIVLALSGDKFIEIFAMVVSAGVAIAGSYSLIASSNGHTWTEYRQVPAIVEVESQRFDLNTLVISEAGSVAYLREGNGPNLAEQSVLADLLGNRDQEREQRLARLAASLIASNSALIDDELSNFSISFVELQGNSPAIASQLSRLPELTFAGQTENGALWRVDETDLEQRRIQISPTQLIPWIAIIGTIALAIPTPSSIRGRARVRGNQ